jgi:hypothetical protein
LLTRVRRAVLAAVLTGACSLAIIALPAGGVSTASASNCTVDCSIRFIDWELLPWTGRFAEPHPLTQTWDGADIVGHWVCAGAYDVPTAAWAGTTSCGYEIASHPYCGCGSREGWGGGGEGNTLVHQTADEYWG